MMCRHFVASIKDVNVKNGPIIGIIVMNGGGQTKGHFGEKNQNSNSKLLAIHAN